MSDLHGRLADVMIKIDDLKKSERFLVEIDDGVDSERHKKLIIARCTKILSCIDAGELVNDLVEEWHQSDDERSLQEYCGFDDEFWDRFIMVGWRAFI